MHEQTRRVCVYVCVYRCKIVQCEKQARTTWKIDQMKQRCKKNKCDGPLLTFLYNHKPVVKLFCLVDHLMR